MLPENIIYVGIAINFFFSFWYIRSVISGKTKPNLISWIIWAIAPFVGVYLALKAGAGWSVSGIFIAGFIPVLVVLVSLFKKNSIWKISAYDIVCGVFSVLALIIYIVTRNLSISILFAILSDGLASLPTIRKSWKFPETEVGWAYFGGIINNLISLLVINTWIFSIYSFNIYFVLINIVILFAIYRKKVLKLS